jgi:hypothetical protein
VATFTISVTDLSPDERARAAAELRLIVRGLRQAADALELSGGTQTGGSVADEYGHGAVCGSWKYRGSN